MQFPKYKTNRSLPADFFSTLDPPGAAGPMRETTDLFAHPVYKPHHDYSHNFPKEHVYYGPKLADNTSTPTQFFGPMRPPVVAARTTMPWPHERDSCPAGISGYPIEHDDKRMIHNDYGIQSNNVAGSREAMTMTMPRQNVRGFSRVQQNARSAFRSTTSSSSSEPAGGCDSLRMLSAAAANSLKRSASGEEIIRTDDNKTKRAKTEALLKYGGLVQVIPGKFVRMVGTDTAAKAVCSGKAKLVKCTVCQKLFQVNYKAKVLFCRNCQHFTPLTPELLACLDKKVVAATSTTAK